MSSIDISNGAHLLQFNRASAKDLVLDYEAGEESWWVNIDRHADRIRFDDVVFVWVSGPADKAGIVGFGLANGEFTDLEHPVSYQDPDGPRTLRPSAHVFWAWASPTPVITRAELKHLDAFADFELFKMPNRPNAFAVTPAQAEIFIGRIKSVIGE